jgi:hypothetical protein
VDAIIGVVQAVIVICIRTIEIIDIIEDSTCHYLIKVSVPALCHIEAFAPKSKKVYICISIGFM